MSQRLDFIFNLDSSSILVANGNSCVFSTSLNSLWENRIGKALFPDPTTTILTLYAPFYGYLGNHSRYLAVDCATKMTFDYQ